MNGERAAGQARRVNKLLREQVKRAPAIGVPSSPVSSEPAPATTVMQLTIDGREVPHATVIAAYRNAGHPVSRVQHAVLAMLRDVGEIRSVEAGVLAHGVRGYCSNWTVSAKAIGCCRYAATDGSAVMKRMAARGLVYNDRRGRWRAL